MTMTTALIDLVTTPQCPCHWAASSHTVHNVSDLSHIPGSMPGYYYFMPGPAADYYCPLTSTKLYRHVTLSD